MNRAAYIVTATVRYLLGGIGIAYESAADPKKAAAWAFAFNLSPRSFQRHLNQLAEFVSRLASPLIETPT